MFSFINKLFSTSTTIYSTHLTFLLLGLISVTMSYLLDIASTSLSVFFHTKSTLKPPKDKILVNSYCLYPRNNIILLRIILYINHIVPNISTAASKNRRIKTCISQRYVKYLTYASHFSPFNLSRSISNMRSAASSISSIRFHPSLLTMPMGLPSLILPSRKSIINNMSSIIAGKGLHFHKRVSNSFIFKYLGV